MSADVPSARPRRAVFATARMLRRRRIGAWLLVAAAANLSSVHPHAVPANDGRMAPPQQHWEYGRGDLGAARWPYVEPQCNGSRQSPIRLQDAIFDEQLQHIHFEGYHQGEETNFTVTNDGHSAKLKVPPLFQISGGNLKGRYVADSLHFHWGKTNDHGSEHGVNGEKFPMEMHIVHIHQRHRSLEEVEHNGTLDSLAVLGFLFEISDRDNVHLQALVNGLQYIRQPGQHKSIKGFPLDHLMPAHHHHYFRYEGSLTVPNCMERVTWTVFIDTIPISSRQLSKFRLLKDRKGQGLYDNFRPEQPLHDRQVYTNLLDDNHWFSKQLTNRGNDIVSHPALFILPLWLAQAGRN